MFEISFQYSPWLLLLALLLIGGVLYWYYFHKPQYSLSKRWLLALLRGLGLLFLVFLLLGPKWIESERFTIKRQLLILEDVSRSMSYHQDSLALDSALEKLMEEETALSEKYTVQKFQFAEILAQDSSLKGDFTNISLALNTVGDRFYGEPLGAMILISDGIYNQGFNPNNYLSQDLAIYALAHGNQANKPDIGIADLRYNDKLNLGRKLVIEADIFAQASAGELIQVRLMNSQGELVDQRDFSVTKESWLESAIFELSPEKEGFKSYTLSIDSRPDYFPENNSRPISFQVLKEPQELWVYSPQTHPDVKAIRKALEEDLNFEIRYSRLKEGINWNSAKLVLAFDWDAELLKKAQELKVPILLFANAQSDFESLAIWGFGGEWSNELEEQYALGNNVGLFPWPLQDQEEMLAWPPLNGIYGSLQKPNWSETLIKKKIASIETEDPLAFSGEKEGHRIGFFAGQGLWRWRVYNYQQKGNSQAFDNFFRQWVEYLLAQEREQSLELSFEDPIYEQQKSKLIAKLYDASGKMVNDPELRLKLSGPDNSVYEYNLSREGKYYRLRLDGFKAGLYQYEAITELGGQVIKDEGSIWVQENNLEKRNLISNRELLKNMAQSSGGKYYELSELEMLIQDIKALPAPQEIRERKINIELLSKWELFFVALILLSIEWFLRKYWGHF